MRFIFQGKWTTLHEAALHGHFNIVQALIEWGAEVNACDVSCMFTGA